MNVSRNIQSAFWNDEKVAEFGTEDKLFFLYLLTNANTKQVGVYKVSPRQMSYESGLAPEVIETLMKRFESEYKLIQYDASSREICILNWGKFNFKKGGKPVEDLIKKELREVTRLDFAEIVARKIPSEKVRMAVLNAIENELTNRPTNRGTNREEVAASTELTNRGTNRHTNRGTNRHTNREEVENEPVSNLQEDEKTLVQSDLTNRGTNRPTNREESVSMEHPSDELTNRPTNRGTNREEEKKKSGRKSHNTKRLQTIENETLEMTDEVLELLELWRAKRGTASDYILDQVKDSILIYGVEKVRGVMERMEAPIHYMVFEEELEK